MGQAVSPANAVARRPPFRKRCPVAGEIYDSMLALPSAWVAGSLADLLRGHILHPIEAKNAFCLRRPASASLFAAATRFLCSTAIASSWACHATASPRC
jgi:hypothetical protein